MSTEPVDDDRTAAPGASRPVATRTWVLGGSFVLASAAALVIAIAMGGHDEPPPAEVPALDLELADMARRAEVAADRIGDLETRIRDLEHAVGERAADASPPCDVEALKATGLQQFEARQYGDALAQFEAAYACSPQPQLAMLATAAACKARREVDARRYYELTPAASQRTVGATCLENGIQL